MILSAAVVLVSCGPSTPRRTSAVGDDAITVASFNFPESVIVAEIYAQALETGGFAVDRQLDLTPESSSNLPSSAVWWSSSRSIRAALSRS